MAKGAGSRNVDDDDEGDAALLLEQANDIGSPATVSKLEMVESQPALCSRDASKSLSG